MAGQAGDNREQRRESAGAAATAAASAQSGRFPHRARRPERGRVAGRGKREAEAGGGGGAGGAVTSARRGAGAGARAGPLAAPCAPSRQRQPTVVLPACSGPDVDLCPSFASPEPGSGQALGRRPGNTCGARASRAGDAEGTARFRPPSLPAPQPVPGAGGTMMNAEPAGSQRSSACRAQRRRSRVRGGFAPRNPGDRGVEEQVPRSETTKYAPSSGAQPDDAES